MMQSEDILDLLRHMEWADALVWKTLFSSSEARADTKLIEKLYHVHVTQHAFLALWQGKTADLPAADTMDISGLLKWTREFYSAIFSDTSTFDDNVLAQPVPDALVAAAEQSLGKGTGTLTIGDTVMQVIMHTTYHRGQLNTRLRELGCEPPLTELFVWIWHGRTLPEWPTTSG